MSLSTLVKAGIALAKTHSPMICFVGGLAAGAAALWQTAKAAPEITQTIDKHTAALELLKEAKESDTPENYIVNGEAFDPTQYKSYKSTRTKMLVRDVAKKSIKIIVCALASVALLCAGFHILNGRLQATTTALAGMTAAYDKLSSNVKYKYGEKEFQNLRYNDLEAIDKAETEEEKKELQDPFRSYKKGNMTSILYDETTTDLPRKWNLNPVLNVIELNQKYDNLNRALVEKNILDMNDVCSILGTKGLKCKPYQAINFVYGIDTFKKPKELEHLMHKINHTQAETPEYRELMAECNRGFLLEFVPQASEEAISNACWRDA